jgi:ElaB/YqjD/DUF883 family membrane-anchored ribosome-binding protein
MAKTDAEMPARKALQEDLKEISDHLSTLRSNVEQLYRSVGATGSHQVGALKDQAVSSMEEAVREEPITTLGIALGVGFLFGVVLGR